MKRNLLIIESAGKIEHLQEILPNFQILQTGGHFMKLDSFDVNNKKIKYISDPKKQTNIDNIKKAIEESSNIYIAADPDREGEAIAQHIYELLSPEQRTKCKRITFNEISEKAVKQAIAQPRTIDVNLVKAQQSRAIADMIIGFKLTELTRNKLGSADASAGRIQSVILELLSDFSKHFSTNVGFALTNPNSPNDFFSLSSNLPPDKQDDIINDIFDKGKTTLKFVKKDSAYSLAPPPTIYEILKDVYAISRDPQLIKKYPNFKNISFNDIAFALQEVYNKGLITYPRTDSRRINNDWIQEQKDVITNFTGVDVTSDMIDTINLSSKTEQHIQDAHECLRPVNILLPSEINQLSLSPLQKLVYCSVQDNIIKTFTPQMKTTVVAKDKLDNTFTLETTSAITEKDYCLNKTMEFTPIIKTDSLLSTANNIIDLLVSKEIGRPSTIPSLIDKNTEKQNTIINPETGVLSLTESGKKISQFSKEQLHDIINLDATKELEQKLDKIASGELDMWTFLSDLQNKVNKLISKVNNNLPDKKINPYNKTNNFYKSSYLKSNKKSSSFKYTKK